MKHESQKIKIENAKTNRTFFEGMFHEKGFTLIELMVAVGVFSVAITASSGLFIASLRGQQRAHVVQNLADNTRFAMETMAKEIRMGSGFQSGTCQLDSCSFISHMMHRDGKNIKFSYDAGAKKIKFDDDTIVDDPLPITSANIEVTYLDFELLGGSATDQERVVIVMKAKTISNLSYTSVDITLQTTVSPRAL